MRAIKATTTRTALLLAFLLLGAGSIRAGESPFVRVKADRVNLRARAEATSEVVGQANPEDQLLLRQVQEEWVEVVPPDRIDLWVHRDFVKDGVSTVDRLNVRAGAGINYTVVGALGLGDRVDVRGQFGEWLKIAPSNATVWVSRELVDMVQDSTPLGPVAAAADEVPPTPLAAAPQGMMDADGLRAPATPVAAGSPAPTDLRLVPLDGQGRLVQREGELKPAPFVFGRPSKFRLVRREGAQMATLCYVRGNTAQLTSLLNQRLLVRGREYWVQGIRQPVIVLERIERRTP